MVLLASFARTCHAVSAFVALSRSMRLSRSLSLSPAQENPGRDERLCNLGVDVEKKKWCPSDSP